MVRLLDEIAIIIAAEIKIFRRIFFTCIFLSSCHNYYMEG